MLLSTGSAFGWFWDCDPQFYMTFDSGVSFSMSPNFCVNLDDWAETEEGYNNRMGTAFLYGLEAGVDLNNWLSMGTGFTYRGPYCYGKFQTLVDDDTTRVRRFNLENFSFMYNIYLNRTQDPCWAWDVCCWTIAPYVGAGVGASRNSVYNFHTLLLDVAEDANDVISIMTPNVVRTVGAQFMVGVEADYNEHLSLALGYRFFYGGKLNSNNYYVDADEVRTITPWCGTFKANELVFSLHVTF